jgi:hypothetical protein
MHPRRPTFLRVVQTDYTAFVSFLFPVVFWGFTAILFALQKLEPIFGYVAAVISVLGILVFVWRYNTLTSVFEDGLETKGIVTGVFFFRDRGRLEYIYVIEGKKLKSGNAVNKTKRTQSFPQGTEVMLVVDRNNLKRAFIQDLYL